MKITIFSVVIVIVMCGIYAGIKHHRGYLVASEREYSAPLNTIVQLKAGILAYDGYMVYNIDPQKATMFIKSMNKGIRIVDAANKDGTPLAWAPMGFIEINQKRYPWWTNGDDEAFMTLAKK